MYKRLLVSSVLLVVFFSIFCLVGCVEKKQAAKEEYISAADSLVSLDELAKADLELTWSHVMPMRKSENLHQFKIIEDRVYGISSKNYLLSIERIKGESVYAWELARPESILCGLSKYGDNLYSVTGSYMVQINPVEGTTLKRSRLGFGTICPPARNKMFYYVGGTDQRVHALEAGGMVEVFEASANDGATITYVGADDKVVVFATSAGTVVGMQPNSAVQVWRFKATGSANGPIVWDDGKLFFSSKDTYVYAIDERTGKLAWKYLTSGLLTKAPVVTDKYVYQQIEDVGLVAINKASGKLTWKLDGGLDMLAEDGNRVYVIARGGKIVVMDNKKLAKIAEVEVPAVSKWISNSADAGIYLADTAGHMVCIKPIDY